MRRLGRFVIHRRWYVLAGAVVLLIVACAFGGSAQSRLSSGGFNEAAAESSRGEALLDERFGTGSPNVLLLVTAQDGDVDSPDVAAAGRRLTEELGSLPALGLIALAVLLSANLVATLPALMARHVRPAVALRIE